MKNPKNKTTQLTLGAILLAVFIILHMIVPGGQKFVQSLLMVITFLPVTIYALYCGIQKALIMVCAGAALSALVLPLEVLLSYAIPALLIGLVAGMCYGKRKRITAILLFAVMHLAQNILEIYVYYVLMDVNIADTYVKVVSMVMDAMPEFLASAPLFMTFAEDLLLCSIPCVMILGAGAKGILSFLLIKLLTGKLVSVIGSVDVPENTTETKFNGRVLSIIYFCAICVCSLVAVMPFFSLLPYHFAFAAFAAAGILFAILYLYYIYTVRVRPQKDPTKRLLYSFLLVALIPIAIYALPLYELYLLKKEKQ